MISKFTRFLINGASRKIFQKTLTKAHYFVLYAQGFGRSGNYTDSGEMVLIKKIISQNAPDQVVLFDVGANVGGYTKMLSENFLSGCKIYCFEPGQATFNILKENVSSYNYIYPQNFALGESNYSAELFTGTDSTQSSLMKRDNKHWGEIYEQKEIEKVAIITVDDFCEKNNISNIHFLKIDTEGFEYNVLLGAKNMLKDKKIKYLQFEFGVCMTDSRYYFKDFFKLLSPDYTIYRILKNGIYPIEHYNERHEVFLTTNYFCILK